MSYSAEMLETVKYLIGSIGPSGYGSKSTAEHVTECCPDLSSVTAIITGKPADYYSTPHALLGWATCALDWIRFETYDQLMIIYPPKKKKKFELMTVFLVKIIQKSSLQKEPR